MNNWSAAKKPTNASMSGNYCELVKLDADAHCNDLFEAFSTDTDDHNWTYLPYGPFPEISAFRQWLTSLSAHEDPFFHSIIDLKTGKAVGIASYLRINPNDGVIEVGHIHFSPLLQRTPLATESMFLMMQRVFDELGYRRYEWKCDSLNQPSRKAAKRFGFQFEGVFRQLTMYKNRNRDTAWYAILDNEWPRMKKAYEHWLSPDNFDISGIQKASLKDFVNN